MNKKVFFLYTILSSCALVGYAIAVGFATIYLQSIYFSNSLIGSFFALASLGCISLQAFVGDILDRSRTLSGRHVLFILNTVASLCAVILYISKSTPVIFVSYTVLASILLALNTFNATLAMEYINAGISFNFSLSRGIGSLAYAVITLLMGFVISYFSVTAIFPSYLASAIVIFMALAFLPRVSPVTDASITQNSSDTHIKSSSYFTFIKENPWIMFLLLCILLMYTSYTSINNYHINIIENVGGNSQHFGISIALAAFVELPAMALFQPVSRRISYRILLALSCAFFFIKIALLLLADNIYMIYLSQSLQFFSYGLFIPASTYFFNEILSDQDKAKGQSLLGIFTFGLSGIIASLLSGLLLDFFNVKTLLFIESAICLIGVLGIVYVTGKKIRR